VKKQGIPGNNRTATDIGKYAGQKVRSNLPELPNTMFTDMIHRVLNGKNMVLATKPLEASYTDVRHWEESVEFIDKNGSPKEP
jgi:hypothetical protein